MDDIVITDRSLIEDIEILAKHRGVSSEQAIREAISAELARTVPHGEWLYDERGLPR